MDQNLLSRIALNEIDRQSAKVFVDLSFRLYDDHQKRRKELVSEEMVRCIHNAALFKCLMSTNTTGPLKERMDYLHLANIFKPNFFKIAEAIQNFQPNKSTFSKGAKK